MVRTSPPGSHGAFTRFFEGVTSLPSDSFDSAVLGHSIVGYAALFRMLLFITAAIAYFIIIVALFFIIVQVIGNISAALQFIIVIIFFTVVLFTSKFLDSPFVL